MSHLIRAVQFLPDSAVVEFTSPATDVRSNGLVMQHALSIPATEEYASRLDDLVEAVQALLADALTDHATYPAAADVPLDEDGEVSPYDNPLERPGVPLSEQD